MQLRHAAHRALASLLIVGLFLSSALPVAAQQPDGGGSIFLPLTANGSAPTPGAQPALLYRTHVRVPTTAMWRDLDKLAVVVLERGDDWALVFADDAQLESLARLRFNPVETNALPTLLAAATAAPLAASFAPLLMQADALGVLAAAKDETGAATARAALRTAMHSLDAAQLTFLVQTAGVDTDADGLSDDQEGFWCTDPVRTDSDFDGTRDGAEVTALKAWMGNALAKAPSTGKPFQGWPHQKVNCYDDDQDSVPDMAESLEVGLSANRESTDRDKFDDGQELFGNTYCPGTSGYCSYGALPRNEDWGVIFAEMPSWVKAPGHHPLVAGFPVPEVDVVASSLRVETVSEITTDHVIGQGTEKSYSTAKTEGQSSSNSETETWNEWQESSTTTPTSRNAANASSVAIVAAQKPGKKNFFTNIKEKFVDEGISRIVNGAYDCVASLYTEGQECMSGIKTVASRVGKDYSTVWNDLQDPNLDLLTKGLLVGSCLTPFTCRAAASELHPEDQEYLLDKSEELQETPSGGEGHALSTSPSASSINMRQIFELSYPVVQPRPTRTESQGSSYGGSRTVTHTSYEEHTVTNGEAFSTEESWGTATAVDSAHAADLWFTYKVRNTGTEYAREITNLAFNLYIGDDPNPATTYFVAADIGGAGKFVNFMPAEEHTYTTQRIPLSLEQMKAIDLGGPIRIVVEDFAYGIDELFYQDAANAGVVIAMEDGTDDGDEAIDTYLIPTWGSETVLNLLGRYFPHETDLNGMMTAIWTPEYRSDTPAWCQEPQRPADQPTKAVWCKHTLSTADWWNVYTDGLGDGSEGFQDTPAVPGATALFRFNQDSDLDGFSDRSEARLGTDPADASSFPRPEVLAGVHNIQVGNKVTSTLSLLNTGLYDAYGVEAVMAAPDDSITIDNNTVGGSGRVKALKQVIVGSRLSLQSPLPAAWTQEGHAVPAPGGYYTGNVDRTYTFTVNCATPGGCTVGAGSWTLDWSDGKGASDRLNVGAGYASPTFLTVGVLGLTLALYTGSVQHGESFTVAATTPRDTFQYTINRAGHTPPLVIVSYNDPQGNHRFVVPSQAMSLTAPTDNLQPFAGQMLQEVGVEIVTSAPFTVGANSVQLLVNNPADATLQNARIFLEFINISGTVVSEVATPVTLSPGPTYTPVSFNTDSFSSPFDATQDYIVMAFLTDYQGNILDTAGRPLSSFQADPLPEVAVDAATLTWNFGTVAQGALLKHTPALANVGYGRLYTYLTPTPGLSLATRADVVGAADLSDYALILRTADLPIGAYDQTATLKTSDPTQPSLTVRVQGTVTAATGDTPGGLQRPLDVPVTVTGPKNQGEWVTFSHNLGPDPQSLHPVKAYSSDYATVYGVGNYATEFSDGTTDGNLFGTGVDGEKIVYTQEVFASPRSALSADSTVGQSTITLSTSSGLASGDELLIIQMQGATAGGYEFRRVAAINGNQVSLTQPLTNSYYQTGMNRAQVIRVPNYTNVTVTSGNAWYAPAWDGSTGGILVFRATGIVTVQPTAYIEASGRGYRGGNPSCFGSSCTSGFAGESPLGLGTMTTARNGSGGGGGMGDPSVVGGGSGSASGGGGGGHATAGATGQNGGGTTVAGVGGTAVGEPTLASVFMGGGGGAGGCGDNAGYAGQPGTTGGGIVFVLGRTVTIQGGIRTNGPNATNPTKDGAGGGGAGGAVLLKGSAVQIGTNLVAATGGLGGVTENDGDGGNGAAGRIRIEYCQSLGGSTNPPASSQKIDCHVIEQVETTPFTSGRLSVPEYVATNKTYQVQYANRLTFAAAGSQTIALRVPAGMANTTTLQTLVSGLPASASFALDIGNDGSNEWMGTVANASTITATALAAAFNTYWVAQGAPVSGSLDVPVKVTMSQPGQVLLSNLHFSTSGSKQRTLRLPAQAVSAATLDLALGGSGQQAISIAVDVGADGSLDWTSSPSTTLPVRLTTGNMAAAINAYLAGKSGLVDVPIRIFVAPDLPVALYDANLTVQPAVDLAAGGLGVSGAVAASGVGRIANSPYLEGDNVPVQATLSNPSSKASGPVTAAFFATAEGWGDWYIGSAFVANIPAGGSVPVSILWDTTGFNGAVPVKVVVNPYGRTPETSPTNNMATMLVSITPLNPPPAVDFTATPTLGGAPLSVQFTSVVTNTVTTYAWDFGDGQVSSAAQPAHSYSAAGVYTVTLTVSGPGGSATKRRSSYVTVTNTPTPPIAAFSASPTTGAAPLTVNFANQSTGTITGYTWSFGDGQSSSVANPSHQYAAPGVYTVALTASGPGGSDVETKSGYITVQAAPVAAFSASPTTGAAPLAVQFTDASTGTVTGWQWSFGDGGASTAQHPAHTYQSAGSYTVTLTASGPGGSDAESKTAYIVVTSGATPPPIAAFSASPTTGVAPLAVQFTDASTGAVTGWQWSFGDGGASTAQHPAHTYQTPGGYTVTLTVTGPGGSDAETKSTYIAVSSTSPDAPVAAFTTTPEQGTAPLAVQFTDASTGIVTAWVWSFGDGGQSGEQHPAHTYQAAGVYTATLTVSGPGGWHSTAKALRVTPPLPAFTADPPAAGGLTVSFAFTPPPGVTHWLWEFGDGQTSTEQNPVHTYAAAGNYTVRLTVYGAGGVSASQELAVTVRAGGQASDGFSLYLPTVRR